MRRLGTGRTRLCGGKHTAARLAGLAASMVLLMLTFNMTDMLLSLAAMLLVHLMLFVHGMMLGLAAALEALSLVLGFLSNLRLAASVEVATKIMIGVLRRLNLKLTLHGFLLSGS